MRTTAEGRRRHVDFPKRRLLIAVLCIVGVLAWLVSMSTMSHPASTAAGGLNGHGYSAAESHAGAGENLAIAKITTEPVGSIESAGALSAGEIACALFGIGCLVALLIVVIRPPRDRPVVTRSAGRRLVRALQTFVQGLPRPPSLIELSISRT